jgi:acyl carrier protein
MDHKTDIRALLQNLLKKKGDTQPFTDSDSLLLSGRLNSVDSIEIVVFLEENYGIDFAEVGFDQGLIDSVAAIESLISSIKSR